MLALTSCTRPRAEAVAAKIGLMRMMQGCVVKQRGHPGVHASSVGRVQDTAIATVFVQLKRTSV